MKTPLTAQTFKHHLTYNWWKYLLVALLSFGLVDMLYTVTAYRPPREKTIQFYVYGAMDQEKLTGWMNVVRESEMQEMESLTPVQLLDDEAYGPMQLMTYLAAGEGDVCLLPREQFLSYAASGMLVPLENDTELMSLFDAAGASLQSGWRKDTETGETHLCGIPQDKLPGLSSYAYAKDGFLCLAVTGRNQENASRFLRILCRDMITVPEISEPAADQE